MALEKEKTIVDFIKLVSPGTLLRTVIDDLIRSDLGAIIVFDCEDLHSKNMVDGGFKINSRFNSQRLFELCKMDGAVIVSSDLKRILFANALMSPDPSIHTVETGTRHKAAERTAKQAKTFVIAVSERRKKTTLYYGSSRYYLKSTEELLRNTSAVLQVLEKQKDIFLEQLVNLNILEMSELVSVSDVCNVLQRAEMILKISESVKKNFVELGKEGSIMHMRYRELLRGIEKSEDEVLRDYASLSLKRSKMVLSNLTFEGLLDLEPIARLIFEKSLEDSVIPQGFRFLNHLTLSVKEINLMVKQFVNLKGILSSNASDLEPLLKGRSSKIREEIYGLREKILSGKVVF